MTSEERRALLRRYSNAEITALDLRRQLDNATFGELLGMLADEGLPLPRAPTTGREEKIARAHEWMFPKH